MKIFRLWSNLHISVWINEKIFWNVTTLTWIAKNIFIISTLKNIRTRTYHRKQSRNMITLHFWKSFTIVILKVTNHFAWIVCSKFTQFWYFNEKVYCKFVFFNVELYIALLARNKSIDSIHFRRDQNEIFF